MRSIRAMLTTISAIAPIPGALKSTYGRASSQPVATSRPMVSGVRPVLKARTKRVSRRRWPQRVAISVSAVDGNSVPTIVANAPIGPATFQPMTATKSTFGPGAAWAIAIEALNCASLIQWCSSTT